MKPEPVVCQTVEDGACCFEKLSNPILWIIQFQSILDQFCSNWNQNMALFLLQASLKSNTIESRRELKDATLPFQVFLLFTAPKLAINYLNIFSRTFSIADSIPLMCFCSFMKVMIKFELKNDFYCIQVLNTFPEDESEESLLLHQHFQFLV